MIARRALALVLTLSTALACAGDARRNAVLELACPVGRRPSSSAALSVTAAAPEAERFVRLIRGDSNLDRLIRLGRDRRGPLADSEFVWLVKLLGPADAQWDLLLAALVARPVSSSEMALQLHAIAALRSSRRWSQLLAAVLEISADRVERGESVGWALSLVPGSPVDPTYVRPALYRALCSALAVRFEPYDAPLVVHALRHLWEQGNSSERKFVRAFVDSSGSIGAVGADIARDFDLSPPTGWSPH